MKRFLLRIALSCLIVIILMGVLGGSTLVASGFSCGGCDCTGCEEAVYDYDSVWIVGPDTVRGRAIPNLEKEPESYQAYVNGKYDAVKDGSWEGPTGDGCVWQKYEVIPHNQTEMTPFGELPVGHVRLTMRYGRGCAAVFK